ncbi:MAG: aminopeptidase [Pseudomonadales bacterium]
MPKDISILTFRAAARYFAPLVLFYLGGCETFGYYSQAIRGQLAVTFARQPVSQLLTDPATPETLKQRLQLTQMLLQHIERELGLPVKGRYQTYVALDQEAVLFSLVATPRFSVTPNQWCYPIVGCAPYRGYFKHRTALAAAARYRKRGFTTYLGAVPAYSTLGWFKDPLLSSFVDWSEAELMALLSHELAHSKVWVDSDVGFNEAFATFVGNQSARNWLGGRDPAALRVYVENGAAWQQLVSMQLDLKAQLSALYARTLSDEEKERESAALYQAMGDCYRFQRAQLGAGRFDDYMSRLNDAALAALATYRDDVPAFAAIYRREQQDWQRFFQAVEALGKLPKEERQEIVAQLRDLGEQQIAQSADDQRAEQIQCQAFSNHGVDRHVP